MATGTAPLAIDVGVAPGAAVAPGFVPDLGTSLNFE